jgi:hypothetical protein
MVNLSKRIALDQPWVYTPVDIKAIFTKFYDQGFLDFDDIPNTFIPVNTSSLIYKWSDKSEILTITYMIINNIIPTLLNHDKEGDSTELKNLIKFFIIDLLDCFIDYNNNKTAFYKKIFTITTAISREYYWDKTLSYLEDQILYVLNVYGYRYK